MDISTVVNQEVVGELPVYLWRMGLQPLIGQMFTLISYSDRQTGQTRRVFAEGYTINGKLYVMGKRGDETNWIQDIQQNPQVMVQNAFHNQPSTAVRVTEDDELIEVYKGFKRNNLASLTAMLESVGVTHERDSLLKNKDRLYFIRFDPTREATPPAVQSDLIWLPVVLIGLVILLWLLSGEKKEAK